ncbi:hypothetical protein F5Y17DRAFT_425943 [Xylariaceae sp. FL0594]|nr:hypothetical protein F5Y17DRAFT_425943 [Xylariaceae sp. FL0594]
MRLVRVLTRLRQYPWNRDFYLLLAIKLSKQQTDCRLAAASAYIPHLGVSDPFKRSRALLNNGTLSRIFALLFSSYSIVLFFLQAATYKPTMVFGIQYVASSFCIKCSVMHLHAPSTPPSVGRVSSSIASSGLSGYCHWLSQPHRVWQGTI